MKAAVDQALQSASADGKALMDLKILDNACGSGHFLVDALNYLTDLALALAEPDTDTSLQALVKQESDKIAEQLRLLNLDYQPDAAQILKRALLKRCIFGVDLNPFAAELARLSLWMDSFIFGTPLSFIEHHVQHGNALMGASVQEFIAYNATEVRQNDLFVDNLSARFDELRGVMRELDAVRDTTAAEVEQSKRLWANNIAPKLNLLARALSFICTRRALLAEDDAKACDAPSNRLACRQQGSVGCRRRWLDEICRADQVTPPTRPVSGPRRVASTAPPPATRRIGAALRPGACLSAACAARSRGWPGSSRPSRRRRPAAPRRPWSDGVRRRWPATPRTARR